MERDAAKKDGYGCGGGGGEGGVERDGYRRAGRSVDKDGFGGGDWESAEKDERYDFPFLFPSFLEFVSCFAHVATCVPFFTCMDRRR